MITEWSQEHDETFATAVKYLADDIADGDDFQWALEHISDLFKIDKEALRHEFDIRNGGRE